MKGKKRINLNLPRQIIAAESADTWSSDAYTSSIFIPDVTELLQVFDQINPKKGEKGHLSLNILFMKLIVEGIKAAPRLNAQVTFHRRRALGTIEIIPNIDITIAMWNGFDTIAPRLPDFGSRSMSDMSAYMMNFKCRQANTDVDKVLDDLRIWHTIHEFKRRPFTSIARIIGTLDPRYKQNNRSQKADRDGQKKELLTIDDFKPGTILITNPGSLTNHSIMLPSMFEIIPHTTAGIGIGPVYEQLVIVNGAISAHKFLPLCIVANHCAVDYGDEVPFIKRVEDICSSPEIIRNWM